MRWRMICFSSLSTAICAAARRSLYSASLSSPAWAATASFMTRVDSFWRSSLSKICVASSSAAPCDSVTAANRPSSTVGTSISIFGLPAFSRSSCCMAHSFLISPWAMSSASRISASGISLAPASTMRMASSVPHTIRSRSEFSNVSCSLGLTTKLPSTLPIRTAPTGIGYGMSEIISAADAPFIARMS